MPGLRASLKELLGCDDLYAALGVERRASPEQVKRGYRKRSLLHHPDRVRGDDGAKAEATKKFQALSAAYKVLSDPERRAVYDETGEVDDEDALDADRDWDQYWRLLFKKITVTDIENFEREYRHSAEEIEDLKSAYVDGDGDMEFILESVPCCSVEDEQRFHDLLLDLVEKEELPYLSKFRRLTAKQLKIRKRKAEKEAEEASEMAREMGLGQGEDALRGMIMKRQEQRSKESDAFLDQLAAKYGGGGAKKKEKGKKKN